MANSTRLAAVVWCAGMAGVLSALALPLPPLEGVTVAPAVLRGLALIQPTLLLTGAVALGTTLAHRVALHAPMAEAIAQRLYPWPALRPQLLPGAVGGLVGGLGLWLIGVLWRSHLPAALLETSFETPLITRVLYGGITEEIMMRWGLMTLLVWGMWRLAQRGSGKPNAGIGAIAITITALLFALGHLPLAIALNLPLSPGLVSYILVANAYFGLIAGVLYWRWGLEAAMIAHILTHLVIAGFAG